MLVPWKESYDKPRQHKKPTEVHIVKAMVFPVVMEGCESWTIKKAEHWIYTVLLTSFSGHFSLVLLDVSVAPFYPVDPFPFF